ncbi:Macrolide glycosyltransferase [Acidisarcina polymorpha]|uniref:Macrolide glycosyltransferase n=1 Tax=Acidisarcina polymorpha TaxID=2211140 RepID=A0A2Z5FZ54_9BACT|nr:macrolide family glycosyltransferase [Acidisarcina polymorpha]AXC12183.1 Macrolide glycosyltransferase [Acidisarcina polymorpha]
MPLIAFFNLPAQGHLNPTVPIVEELVRQGIDVHYFIGEKYRQDIERAGATFHPLPPLKRLGGGSPQAVPAPDDRQIALMPFAMGHQAPQVIPKLVEELQALRPDCIVYNTLSLWPRLAANILDLPAIGFRPFHAPRASRRVGPPFSTERLARLAAATDQGLSSLMTSYGKSALGLNDLVSQEDDRTLMFIVKELQHDAGSFDDRFLFVGPCLVKRQNESWPFAESDMRRSRVYISLGTMRNDDPEFYRDCFSGFRAEEWEAVMSVGNHIDLNLLEPVPKNFIVARSVRQTAILPHADVFVTHGGLNSVMESLACGVPMVLVPSIKEQRLTADRVQALGCGVVVEREAITAESLLQNASAIAGNEDVRGRVSQMQDNIARAGGYKGAAEAIIDYATRKSS